MHGGPAGRWGGGGPGGLQAAQGWGRRVMVGTRVEVSPGGEGRLDSGGFRVLVVAA